MRTIVIKLKNQHCRFLRTEAVSKAIEYEERVLAVRKEGKATPMIYSKERYVFYVYHTKKTITVEIGYV